LTKADFAGVLSIVHDISDAIQDIGDATATNTDALTGLELDAIATIRSSLEVLQQHDRSLSWWSFPYIEGQKAWRFCQGLCVVGLTRWSSQDGLAEQASYKRCKTWSQRDRVFRYLRWQRRRTLKRGTSITFD